jgi:3-isopropylmalate/(R)-2-methylmalate dehydratase small subunit
MTSFSGKALCLDRSDINTDEIIPARYLTEIEKSALGPHLLEDLVLDGFDPARDLTGVSVLVARKNFGCGSSREHAPWALEVTGIRVVLAESFARIFRQNMFNCGMPAIELDVGTIARMFDAARQGDVMISVDMDRSEIRVQTGDDIWTTGFRVSDFDRQLVTSGGWLNYADTRY